ncbi:MAG: thioredoxin domain-containing protein, partial [Streptosporangiaceae bacterium]
MSSFSRPGAVDLSALKKQAPSGASAGTPGGGPGGYVIDVTEQAFQTEVVEPSMRHVVVLSLWSPRAPESESFNGTLARVANSYEGRLLLAQVDVDTSPQIAQAVGAQGVPFVLGLVKGQPVPLFQGTVEEAEVRRFFDELLKVADANGVSGVAEVRGAVPDQEEDTEEPAEDPRFAEADEAFATGDFDAAIAAYQALLTANPA